MASIVEAAKEQKSFGSRRAGYVFSSEKNILSFPHVAIPTR
jgi:hypothetical protein